MEFAYLDESGDDGAKGSKHLVCTLLITSRKKDIITLIRRTKRRLLRRNVTARWLNRMGGEIKLRNFPDKSLLNKVLKDLSMINMKVYAIAFEKGGKKIDKVNKPVILFNLFKHIFDESKGIIPSNISADLNFFNREKVNRFLLQKFEKTSIIEKENKSKKPSMECHFNHISEELYKKIKLDPKNMIISINHITFALF